jgi:hypothetical protein
MPWEVGPHFWKALLLSLTYHKSFQINLAMSIGKWPPKPNFYKTNERQCETTLNLERRFHEHKRLFQG